MNGRQGDEFPQGDPSGGFGDPGPGGSAGSGDWFAPRRPAGPDAGASGQNGAAPPEWSAPQQPGGFSGSSGAGGTGQYGTGNSGQYGSGGLSDSSGLGAYGEGGYSASRSESGTYGSYDPFSVPEPPRPGDPGDPGGSGAYGGSGGSGGYGGGNGDSDDWEGRGRRPRRKRRVLVPLAGVIGLAVLAGVSVYAFAGSAGGCGSGSITLNVAVAPDIEPAVKAAVGDFNSQKKSVGGKCVKAVVNRADPSAVTTLLSGQGVSEGQTQQPDVWIPDSTLWADLVQTSDKGKNAVRLTKTSVAETPLVVAMPKPLASKLASSGMLAKPSWDNLLTVAGGMPGGAVTKNQTLPAGLIKLSIADPTRNASGMTALMLTNTLLASDPNKQTIFAGMVRTVQHATTENVAAQFKSFGPDRLGHFPVALAPEQAVWRNNHDTPADPAVAIYPDEGTITLDYPYTVTTSDAAKAEAAALLEKAMGSANTQSRVRELGFRTADGKAPDTFSDANGLSPRRPRPLPTPSAQDVAAIMQAWSKLSLSIRMLTVVDVSNTMAAKIPGSNLNRLAAMAKVAQGGLALMSDDTELGLWVFSNHMDGNKPYRQIVPVGPLGERPGGSMTRREAIQTGLAKTQVNVGSNTALYGTLLAAYKYMKNSYKPDMINSMLLLTNGTDHLPGGLSIAETVAQLKKMYDPQHPVEVIIIGFGKTADRAELEKLTSATSGGAYIAQTPEEVQKIFLEAISKRMCNPTCGAN